MKKNFFKKLSFVMALAMTVSVVAPAASAFAATAPKLTATTKYLYVNETGKASEYDFGIKNLAKGSKVAFVSDNEEVATVDKATGLTTAVSRGTAHVSAKITLATKKTVTLKATVYVRDYVKSVDITAPATKYVVGTEYDFNRTFVNNGGSKTTSSICRWSVDKTGATVDASTGKITFTEVGTFKVTVDAFNSAADYETYKTSKDATLVKATKTLEVSVVPTLAVVQKDVDSITLSFNAPMTDVAKNLSIYTLVGTTEVLVTTAKPVSMSDDKKTATVDFYVPLTEKATYVVKYTGVDPIQFVAASTAVDQVTKVTVKTTEAEINKEKTIEVQLWNANNVDISTDTLRNRVTFVASSQKVYLNGSKLVMFTKGDTTTIDATFHTYKYEGGKEVGTLVGTGTIVAVDQYSTVYGKVKAWTMVASGANFKDVKQLIAVGETGKKLFVQVNTDLNGTAGTTDTTGGMDKFTFTSSDPTILYIDNSNGQLYPNKAGTVAVVVKYDGKPIDVLNITVNAERKATTLVLDKTDVSVSNRIDDQFTVNAKLKDQYGNDMDTFTLATEKMSGSEASLNVAVASGKSVVVYGQPGAVAATKGAYYFKVTATSNSVSVSSYLTVNVTNTTAASATSYVLSLGATEVDSKSTTDTLQPTLSINLNGYADGVKVTNEALSSTAFYVVLTDPNGSERRLANGETTFELTTLGAGNVITPITGGTYKVTAKYATGAAINVAADIKYFTVKNTQAVATYDVEKTTYGDETNLDTIARNTFKVYVDGTAQLDSTITVVPSDVYGTLSSGEIFIKNIKVKTEIGTTGYFVVQTVEVNQRLTK